MKRTVIQAALLAGLMGSMATATPAAVFLQEIDQEHDGQGGVTALSGAQDMAVSPDGRNLYVAAGLDDGLVVFTRNTTNGTLTFLEEHIDGQASIDGLDAVRGVAVSRDGKHVYTAALLDSAVMVFSRNAGSGALTRIETHFDVTKPGGSIPGLLGAMRVIVSADGLNVYVGCRSSDSVAVFSRNSATGRLTYRQTVLSAAAGGGLDAVEGVAISPNDQFVYAAAELSASVVAFERTGANGELTFRQALFDGVGGADGLDEVGSVSISPDGKHLYASCYMDAYGHDWYGVYGINATSGTLSFVESRTVVYDPACSSGISTDSRVVFGADGGRLAFAINPWKDGIFIHSRDLLTGTLTPVAMKCENLYNGYFGLQTGVISTDGRTLYAVNIVGDIVAFDLGDPASAFASDMAAAPGGRLVVTYNGSPGTNYVVECTTNLLPGSQWTPVFTNVAGPDGLFVYTNTLSGTDLRIYRSAVN